MTQSTSKRKVAVAVAPAAFERLEGRVFWHGAIAGVEYPVGTLVPWAFAPITAAGPVSPPVSPPPVSPPPVSPPPPVAGVGAIAGLTLVDAAGDVDLSAFASGAALDLSAGSYSVRANVDGTAGPVGSVRFLLDGVAIRIESSAPFSVAGDTDNDYAPWAVSAGSHTLTVVPYAEAGAAGVAGTAVSVAFTAAGTPPSPPAGLTKINWATKAASPVGKAEALTATWNNRVYVFGGFAGSAGPVTRSDYYDPAANAWTPIAKLPQSITHAGVAQDTAGVYFVGGYTGKGDGTGYGQIFGSAKVWRYDFAANTYAEIKSLPRALAGGGAALVGRKLHYFGGYELNRTDSTVHLVLDLDNQAAGWQVAAAMTNTRNHLGTAVVGGKIYAIAGQTGTDEGLVTRAEVQVYDPATNAWTPRRSMPRAASHVHSATFLLPDGRIAVMGGESAHNVPIRDAYAYDPSTDTWQTLTSLPANRFSGVASAINGKVYFTTGGSLTTTWEGTLVP